MLPASILSLTLLISYRSCLANGPISLLSTRAIYYTHTLDRFLLFIYTPSQMSSVEYNWVVVRGFRTGVFSAFDAERFTRNIPDAYAVRFNNEGEAYHYWENAYSHVQARIPDGWCFAHVCMRTRTCSSVR